MTAAPITCIVPLAGPQILHPKHGIVPLMPIRGEPLIRRAIESRPWWRSGALSPDRIVFVLRQAPEHAQLKDALSGIFLGSRCVTLSTLTGGALLSALAGVSLLRDLDCPLCVDLADILFEAQMDLAEGFARETNLGATLTTFHAREECYSYVVTDAFGRVSRAAEKQVISNEASAGTYAFRNPGVFLSAAGLAMARHRDELTVRGALFVCPALNSVLRLGLDVRAEPVGSVDPVSKWLHGA